jgi:hypothetical protein
MWCACIVKYISQLGVPLARFVQYCVQNSVLPAFRGVDGLALSPVRHTLKGFSFDHDLIQESVLRPL